MPPWGAVKRRDLITGLRRLGFQGPFSGGKHEFVHTLLTDLDRAILASRAVTSVEIRASVADYCRALTRDRSTPNPFTGALAVWVEKVARHAYKTLPAEVTALRDEGLSEDEIFELTVAAAYGAARGRYDQALTALEEGYRP
jgi:hypothetical protein